MQNLELLLVISAGALLLFPPGLKEKIGRNYRLGFLLVVLALQVLVEGYRWQMLPAYLLSIFALLQTLFSSGKKSPLLLRIGKYAIVVVLLGLACFLPMALPVFKLPKATGSYLVGTRDIHLVLDRKEDIPAGAGKNRELMVKVWYPTDARQGPKDPYCDPAGRAGFARKYGLPPFMMNYLDLIKTNVFREVAVAEGQFPVLVFSHGYHSKANGYYALLSELASQGYIIFAPNHTYESTGSTFPDDRRAFFDRDYARKIQENTWPVMEPAVKAFKEGLSFDERHPIVRKSLKTYFVKDMTARWAQDIRGVIDQLEDWNSKGAFAGKLNVRQLGVFGHSRGGGAAAEALRLDERIQAAANVDGVQWGPMVDTVLQKPFLFISADWPADHEDLNSHIYYKSKKKGAILYDSRIQKTAHSNFMDIPFMVPFRAVSGAGSLPATEAIEITRGLLVNFFDRHIKAEKVSPGDLKDKYAALEMEVHQGASALSKKENKD